MAAEVSAKWLLDPELAHNTRGIVVEVKGTFPAGGSGGWHGGDYEGKQGVVLSLFDTQNGQFESTARVRFFQPVDALKPILAVPVQHLRPVHPEGKGEEVILLGGDNKGQEARVEQLEPPNTMVLTTKATFLVIDSLPEMLVRVRAVDEVGNFLTR